MVKLTHARKIVPVDTPDVAAIPNRARTAMAEKFRAALHVQDGTIDHKEAVVIDELRKDLGLSVKDADSILESVQKNKLRGQTYDIMRTGSKGMESTFFWLQV
jgi:hypothetical protein